MTTKTVVNAARRLVALSLLMVGCASAARADLYVEVPFTGVIEQLANFTNPPNFPDYRGQTFAGSYIGDINTGQLEGFSITLPISITLPQPTWYTYEKFWGNQGYVYVSPGNYVFQAIPGYNPNNYNPVLVSSFNPSTLAAMGTWQNSTGNLFSSCCADVDVSEIGSLTLTSQSINFEDGFAYYPGNALTGYDLVGTITSIGPAVVTPEPGTSGLAVLGLVVLGLGLRRPRAAQH